MVQQGGICELDNLKTESVEKTLSQVVGTEKNNNEVVKGSCTKGRVGEFDEARSRTSTCMRQFSVVSITRR